MSEMRLFCLYITCKPNQNIPRGKIVLKTIRQDRGTRHKIESLTHNIHDRALSSKMWRH
jgi:hypothetical protein